MRYLWLAVLFLVLPGPGITRRNLHVDAGSHSNVYRPGSSDKEPSFIPATERTHYWGAVAGNLRAIDIWIGEEASIGQGHGSRMMTYAIGDLAPDQGQARGFASVIVGFHRIHCQSFGFSQT